MACPPTAYTVRGGVGTVETAATVAAALLPDDPDPADPGKLLALPAPSPEPQAEPQRAAACCFRGWRGSRHPLPFYGGHHGLGSEDRGVGQEWGRQCRVRWLPYPLTK